MGYREIMMVTSVSWILVTKSMLNILTQKDRVDNCIDAVMGWIIVTVYMIFRAFVR